MIAIDTNVLVRLLVEDDADQTARARSLVEELQAEEESAWVSELVLCELVWVLSRSYEVPRAEIGILLDNLLRARHLVFLDSARLRRALARFRRGRGDFADYLISEGGVEAGAGRMATFDRTLLKEEGFFEP